MRYMVFIVYVATSVALAFWALSDLVYGSTSFKKFGVRLLLCIVWPLALLSKAGRETLLFFGKEGETDDARGGDERP